MTFTRLTIVGLARRADLVVPDDETFAALLPDILDLLGESAHFDGAPLRLIRRTGAQIELAATPAELDVPHGEVLRVVRADDAPPPPEVADVTDVVAESLELRHDRWGIEARRWTGLAGVAASAVVLGTGALGALTDAAFATLAGVWVAAILAAVVFGRLGYVWTRLWTTALAFGVSAPLAFAIMRAGSDADAGARVVLVAVLLAGAAVGLGMGVAARKSGPAWGGLAAFVGAGGWLALGYSTLSGGAAAALVGIAALVTIGVLPSIALTTSGLSKLDDSAIAGELPSRNAVASSLDEAYSSLAWVGVTLAGFVGASGVVLALAGALYALLLALAFGLILSLRSRQFPLVVHVVPLWVAAVVVLMAVAASPLLTEGAGLALVGAICVGAVILVGATPAPHVRVRLRRWGNVLEFFAVLSLVPLLLGVLAVYPDLLQVFP